MAKLDYYSVVVPNKPGKGEHVLSALKEAGVNFVAIWGYPLGKSKAKIDLVAEDPALLKKAAKQLKIELGKKQTAFHIIGEDRPGAVAEDSGETGGQKDQRLCRPGPLRRERAFWRTDSGRPGRRQEGGEGAGVAGRPSLASAVGASASGRYPYLSDESCGWQSVAEPVRRIEGPFPVSAERPRYRRGVSCWLRVAGASLLHLRQQRQSVGRVRSRHEGHLENPQVPDVRSVIQGDLPGHVRGRKPVWP